MKEIVRETLEEMGVSQKIEVVKGKLANVAEDVNGLQNDRRSDATRMKKMEADIEGEKRKTDANTKAIEREKKKTDVNAKNIKSLENGQTSHSRRLAAVEVAQMEKADADAARDEKLDLLAKQQEADRALAEKHRKEDLAERNESSRL